MAKAGGVRFAAFVEVRPFIARRVSGRSIRFARRRARSPVNKICQVKAKRCVAAH